MAISKKLTDKKIKSLLKSGKWMIRFDDDGISYGGFRWKGLGRWTVAPDWNTEPECKGGLFGQSPTCNGLCVLNTTMALCEVDKVVEANHMIKTNRAMRLATNEDIPVVFISEFGISLVLKKYDHPLPEGFTHCGRSLWLKGYKHPLPAGFTHCGGYLDLEDYDYPLPKGFTHCGDYLYLSGYKHPLPPTFTHCGGNLYLDGYKHPLPEGFQVNKK